MLVETYLSGIMGNQTVTFFIIQGLYRGYTTPKGPTLLLGKGPREVVHGFGHLGHHGRQGVRR